MTPKIIQPDGWAPALGYSNGMLMADGTRCISAGKSGGTRTRTSLPRISSARWSRALTNIAEIVRAAGGDVTDIGRLTWFVKDKDDYLKEQRVVGQAYRRVFGKHFPAMSMLIVKDLVEDEALIEIEATAYISPAVR